MKAGKIVLTKPVREVSAGQHVCSVAISGDASLLAAGTADGHVLIWEAKSLKQIAAVKNLCSFSRPVVDSLAFIDNKTVVAAGGRMHQQTDRGRASKFYKNSFRPLLVLVDVGFGEVRRDISEAASSFTPSVAATDSGFVACDREGGIRLFDGDGDLVKFIQPFGEGGWVSSLAFCPDVLVANAGDEVRIDAKRQTVFGGENCVLFLDPKSLKELDRRPSPHVGPCDLAASGKYVASSGGAYPGYALEWNAKAEVFLWEDRRPQACDYTEPKEFWRMGCIFVSDDLFATSGSNGVKVWDVASRSEVARLETGNCSAVAAAGDLLAAAAGSEVVLWDRFSSVRTASKALA